jgi:hypothetical protein
MTEHFSLWQERCLSDLHAKEEAEKVLQLLASNESFSALCKTPQSGPFHTEGPTTEAHLLRGLTVLFACQKKEQGILAVDEWLAAKNLRGFFMRLQETLEKEKNFLTAYFLAHDIGKKDTAHSDEKGWHYPQHAERGAAPEYAAFREACLVACSRPVSEAKFLRELVRVHMEIIREIRSSPETKILAIAKEVAERQGINVARFIALLPAAFLLDAVTGSRDEYIKGFEKAALMLRFAEREYATFPEIQGEDELRLHREQKETRRKLLESLGLGHEEWFVRLNTPHGKERGRVAGILNNFIRGVESEDDVRYVGSENAHELRMRVKTLEN